MITTWCVLLGLELIGFWHFYATESGCKAVYHTWYAWCIDALGIASGSFLMWLAVAMVMHPVAYVVPHEPVLASVLFVIGSWQAVIHAVKWVQRIRT